MRGFIILLISCFVISCNSVSKKSIQIIDTQIVKASPQNISRVFEKTGQVALETKDSFLIHEIKEVLRTSDHIFINASDKVLQYDLTGRFVRQIGSAGNDTGQYRQVVGIVADTAADNLIITSARKLLIFDFKGNYLREIALTYGVLPEFSGMVNGRLWVYYKWMGVPAADGKFVDYGKFFQYNDQFEVIDSSIVRMNSNNWKVFSRGHTGYNLSVNDSGIYMYCPVLVPETVLRDTIYEITGTTLDPVMRLDFSKILSVKEDVLLDPRTQKQDDFFKAMYDIRSVTISNIYRTNRFIFAEYAHLGKTFIFCYDLIGKQTYHMTEGFTNDLFGTGKLVQIMPLDLNKGEFCFVMSGEVTEGNFDWMSTHNDHIVCFVRTRE